MYTHIHSIDWDFIPDYSTRTISYYEHKRNHEILAEYWTPDGYEYYYCSPEQMQTSNVGIYIGDNTFVHAANSDIGVVTTSLSVGYYAQRGYEIRRII